jgi:hypothetical protein
MKSEPGSPMTLGNAAKAELRLIVWCRSCKHQVERDEAAVSMVRPSAEIVPFGRRCQRGVEAPLTPIQYIASTS